MFEREKLLGISRRPIALQSRAGRPIRNCVELAATEQQVRVYEEVIKPKHPRWQNRKGACGVYNCFGLVWACRRTAIEGPGEIETIRHDDGYRQIAQEDPEIGDVAVYRDPSGEIQHVARVAKVEHRAGYRAPLLLSKWGPWGGESFHEPFDHAVSNLPKAPFIEYWTDRPQ